jgi:hypothetical protein
MSQFRIGAQHRSCTEHELIGKYRNLAEVQQFGNSWGPYLGAPVVSTSARSRHCCMSTAPESS